MIRENRDHDTASHSSSQFSKRGEVDFMFSFGLLRKPQADRDSLLVSAEDFSGT